MLHPHILKLLSEKKFKTLSFYPDFLPYQMDKATYWQIWQQINDKTQGSYLYSDGITVKRVGFLQYAFETIAGWFGLSNYCDSSLIQLSLKKISYYGYVHGFNTPELFEPQQEWDKSYKLSGDYVNNVLCPRNDINSAQLQNELLKDYQYNTPYFSQEYPCKTFGQTYIQNHLYDFAADIDPQDTQSIIPSLLKKSKDLNPIKDSTLYREYLHYLLKQSQKVLLPENKKSKKDLPQLVSNQERKAALDAFKVLDLDPTLEMDYDELFLVAHLVNQEYQEAAHLLERCSFDEASSYIDYYYDSPIDYLAPYLQEGTALAKNYSVILADKAYEIFQRNKGGWLNSLFTRDSGSDQKPLYLMKQAIRLDPTITNQFSIPFALIYLDEGMLTQASELLNAVSTDHVAEYHTQALFEAYNSLDKVKLLDQNTPIAKNLARKIYLSSCKNSNFLSDNNSQTLKMILHLYPGLVNQYPEFFFKYFIQSEQWDEAYTLFSNAPNKNLPGKEKTLLGEYLNTKAENLYLIGRNLDVNPSFEKAEVYKLSLDNKVKAFEVLGTPEAHNEVAIHGRLYAKQLAASVEHANDDTSRASLEQALQLLNEATIIYPEDPHLPLDYAKICLQYVSLLRNSCLTGVPKGTKVNQKLTQHPGQIMNTLNTFISYAEQVTEKSAAFKRELAEVYFQRAECIELFKLYDKNSKNDYLQAVTYADDNAFYALSYSEQCSNESEKAQFLARGLELLTQSGFTEAEYFKWRNEQKTSVKRSASEYYPNYSLDLAEKNKIHAEKVVQFLLKKLTPRMEEVAAKISNVAINTLKYDLNQAANKRFIEPKTQIEQYGDVIFKNLINKITSMGISEFSSFTFGNLFENPAIKKAVKDSLRKGASDFKLLDKSTSHSDMYHFSSQIKEKISTEMLDYLSSIIRGVANTEGDLPLTESQANVLLDALEAASSGDMSLYEKIQDQFNFLNLDQMDEVEFIQSVLNKPTPNQALHVFFQRCYEVHNATNDKQSKKEFLNYLTLAQEPNVLELMASCLSPKQMVAVGAAFGGIDAINVILNPSKFIEKTALNVAYNPNILVKGINKIGSLFSAKKVKPVHELPVAEEKEISFEYQRGDYELWKNPAVEEVDNGLSIPGLN